MHRLPLGESSALPASGPTQKGKIALHAQRSTPGSRCCGEKLLTRSSYAVGSKELALVGRQIVSAASRGCNLLPTIDAGNL
jgi:hypothetical protein